MKLVIIIEKQEEKMLERISAENKLTPEKYASNIVKSFLQGQIIGEYKKKFRGKTLPELTAIFGDIP